MRLFTSKAVRLIVALALFVGWMSYLGYAALTKSRSPIVSRIQAAAAPLAVVADVQTTPNGKPHVRAKVVESLSKAGPAAGTELLVMNLEDVRGFTGPGPYLLLLQQEEGFPSYVVVGPQRSPGNDRVVGRPLIYPWNEDVRREYEYLRQ